jgi:hypothetical protein
MKRAIEMKTNLITGALRALLGALRPTPPQAVPEMIDPDLIRASIPTMCDELPPLDAITDDGTDADLRFHEDDWRQIEFLPRTALPEIKRMLGEYTVFERENRTEYGWNKIYVRKFTCPGIATGKDPQRGLANLLGVEPGPAPILFAYSAGSSRVRGGFTFSLGGNCHLYACGNDDGHTVLGACVGADAEGSRLVAACAKLQAAMDVVLVDWRAQIVILDVAGNQELNLWQRQACAGD